MMSYEMKVINMTSSYRQTLYVGTTPSLAPANCLISFAVAMRQNTHLKKLRDDLAAERLSNTVLILILNLILIQ